MAKIMLVEDDNNLREIYAARLQAEGYTVVSAKDGEEALVIAKSEKPDLIISDIMMPKISGFEMLDIMRNTDGLRDVKIIMLTALGQSDDEMRANRLGADRYLVKSQVTLEDIVKVSRGLLEGDDTDPPAAPATPDAPAAPAAPTTPTDSDTSTPAADAPDTTPAPTVAPLAMATPPSVSTASPVATAAASPTPPAITDNNSATVQKDEAQVDKAAPSAAQENTDIQNEVESFVAGATTEATPPSQPITPSEPTIAPSAASAPETSEAMTETETAANIADDKPSGGVPEPISLSAEHVSSSTAPMTPPSERKKTVITPIDSMPKKDLTTLLAQEEAKEAISTTVNASATTAPVVGDSNGLVSPTTVSSANSGPDPNSIAL